MGWPDLYWTYFERLTERHGAGPGGKEFLRIVRCHLQHGSQLTAMAVEECSSFSIFSADAVLHKVTQLRLGVADEVEFLDLTSRPSLESYAVLMQDTSQYQALL